MIVSIAKIISYNLYGETVCASAARISTTKGNALEIFNNSIDIEKNKTLIGKVLKSGHKSVIEHAVFSIAFENVSVFVEQFFIERRLASFTVKSRRYVDFSNQGYYIPTSLEKSALKTYCDYMDKLFSAYQFMLENDVPKEDARFLLPYSFHSNFYCTLNARELAQIIKTIMSDDYQTISELREIAKQLIEQLNKLFPCILSEFDQTELSKNLLSFLRTNYSYNDITFVGNSGIGNVELIQAPAFPMQLLKVAYRYNHLDNTQIPDVQALIQSHRPRELEQLTYTFVIHDISLAAITHIVRHRMQSIIIPQIKSICPDKMIVPASIEQNPILLDYYRKVVIETGIIRKKMMQDDILSEFAYYYILSGNLTDIMTTVNTRELTHFIRLRSCNRAQWEIRNISISMLIKLRESFPELFDLVGPSCYMNGKCPEGRFSCGRINDVKDEFNKL